MRVGWFAHFLRQIPDGKYEFSDYMDNDGITDTPIKICVAN